MRGKWPEFPVVSGLLAASRTDRLPYARIAALGFLKQDWPHLHLVVFNGTKEKFLPRQRQVTEMRLRPMTRAEMLTICLHNANGEYVTVLSDDTWYGPKYVTSLMKERHPEALVLLRRKMCYSVSAKEGFLVDDDSIFCPLFNRSYPVKFEVGQIFSSQFRRIRHAEGPLNSVVKFVR